MDPTDNPPADDAGPADVETAAREAMDAGIANARDEDDVPEKAPEPVKAEDPVPGSVEAAKAAETPVEPAATTEPVAPVNAEDDRIEAKLSAVAAKRFRELRNEAIAVAPLRDALEKAGIKDVAELPKLVEKGRNADDLIRMVQETGATPDQYGEALDIIAMVNAAGKGDRVAAERAYERLEGTLTGLAKLLGKEVPGVHDPLAEHADLMSDVENGEVTRKHALEIAKARNALKMDDGRRQVDQQAQVQAQERATAEAALAAIDGHLVANDPQYAIRRPALSQMVAQIRESYPPSQWADATKRAYQAIASMPVSAPVPPRAPVGPVRPTGHRPALAPVTNDPMEAMNIGIAAAHGG